MKDQTTHANAEGVGMLTSEATFAAADGSAAEVESGVCSSCEGYGSITYNPNLNPNAFPAMASAKCTYCSGTGRVEKAKPQPNEKGKR